MTKSHYDLLGMEINRAEDGVLTGQPTGVLGKMFKDEFDTYMDKLNQGKIIAERNGGNIFSLYQPAFPSPAGVRVIAHRIQRKYFNQVIPSTATMSVTYACQCDCRHCSAENYRRSKRGKEISLEKFKDAIDQAIELGVVNIALSGGEPLLRKGIFELINHVDPEKANVMMFTNGILLNQENIDKLAESNLFALMVSLDSSISAEHNEARRYEGLFDQLIEGTKRAVDAGILVGLSTYATREAIDSGELEGRIKLGADLGVCEVTIFDPVPTGCLLDNSDIILTDDERQKIVDLSEKYNGMDTGPKISPQAFINSPMGAGCFAAYHQFYMTGYGDICPCDFTPLSFGNVHDDSLRHIWDRMLAHSAYKKRQGHCRMQSESFRARYIDTIPAEAPTPFYIGDQREKVGILAGFGDFPLYFASQLKEQGYEVYVVSIEDEASSPGLEAVADKHWWARVGEMDRVISIFREAGVRDVVMVGKVHKAKLYSKVELDERMTKVLRSVKIKDDISLLRAIGSEIESEGLRIREPTAYLPDLLPKKGTLTLRKPTEQEQADIDYGFQVAKKMAELGIGQTVVLKDGAIIAVEALEGTDKTILRSGHLTPGGGVVCKVSAPNHDLRFDAPVIGTDTINTLHNSGARVLAIEAGKVILLEQERVVMKANERDISIVAV